MGDPAAHDRPLLLLPEDHLDWKLSRPPFFPVAVVHWQHKPLALRERAMLWFINEVTDDPAWRTAVTDETVVAAWREAMVHSEPIAEPQPTAEAPSTSEMDTVETATCKHSEKPFLTFSSLPPELAAAGFTSTMFDACVAELRAKSTACDAQGNDTVPVFDADAVVFKRTLPDALTQRVRTALAPLEKEAHERGDYRADHGNVLLPVVHPSLFPIVYGLTTTLDADTLTRDNCLRAMGRGNVIGHRAESGGRSREEYKTIASVQHSWLPTDVEVGANGKCHLVSYVNNLHPKRDAAVYDLIEDVIEAALPSFALTIQAVKATRLSLGEQGPRRIPWQKPFDIWSCLSPETCKGKCYVHPYVPLKGIVPFGTLFRFTEDLSPHEQSVQDAAMADRDRRSSQKDRYLNVFRQNHPVAQPEPEPPQDAVQHSPLRGVCEGLAAVNLGVPGVDRLQVIVAINNHYLTPENPSYAGGRWHREGMRNEHIVASAIYYYDIENITTSRLSFRATQAERPRDDDNLLYLSPNRMEISEQDRETRSDVRDKIYGKASPHVSLGSTRSIPGRLVVFPNVLDHKVEPFGLADKTRPGHRKAISIFLVDPALRIQSTSRVPPQQLHWAEQGTTLGQVGTTLPPELALLVYEELGCPIDLKAARRIRAEMLRERKRVTEQIPDMDMKNEDEESDDDMD